MPGRVTVLQGQVVDLGGQVGQQALCWTRETELPEGLEAWRGKWGDTTFKWFSQHVVLLADLVCTQAPERQSFCTVHSELQLCLGFKPILIQKDPKPGPYMFASIVGMRTLSMPQQMPPPCKSGRAFPWLFGSTSSFCRPKLFTREHSKHAQQPGGASSLFLLSHLCKKHLAWLLPCRAARHHTALGDGAAERPHF